MEGNEAKKEPNKVSYYTNDFSIVACIGNGYKGMFTAPVEIKSSSEWRFVVVKSIEWDNKHRNIYEAHHDYDRCSEEMISLLPPLPPVPEFNRIEWHENFAPENPILVKDFPNIAKHIQKKKSGRLKIFFILYEDLWETYSGDGTSLDYNHKVFISEKKANRIIKKNNIVNDPIRLLDDFDVGQYYHLKECTLLIEGNEITSHDWMPQSAEHYRLDEIVEDVEKLLSN
jgi:hypothetical protein